MPNLFQGFSEWTPLTNIEDVPNTQVVYVIRVVGIDKKPISINRARASDNNGILNIGSGKGRSRLKKLRSSFTSMKTRKDWNRWKHHQLVLWILKFEFAELLKLQSINADNIEYRWAEAPDPKSARKLEKETIIKYKHTYADIPIGNLKSW